MNLWRSIFVLGGFTSLSRILGLIREILMAQILGVGFVSDAFLVAFKLPNFFRRIFAEGAMNISFVPVFGEKVALQGKEEATLFANHVFSLLLLILGAFVTFVIVFMPECLQIVIPGLVKNQDQFQLTILYSRLTFSYILFMSLTALCGGILNSFYHFKTMAAAPLVLNVFMIGGLVLAKHFHGDPALYLSISVLLSGVCQFLWLYTDCRLKNVHLRFNIPVLTPDVKKMVYLMGPAALGAGVFQVNLLVDTFLASFLETGSISYLYYADRLSQLPLSVIGISISTVILPLLSQQLKKGDLHKAHQSQRQAILLGMHLSLPSACVLIALSFPLISLIYGHGKFTQADIQATAHTLMAYAIGIPGYVFVKIFSTSFFARQNTKTPVNVAMVCVAINFCLNLILMQVLSFVGLALSTAISAWLNALFLGAILYKKKALAWDREVLKTFVSLISLSISMGGIIYLLSNQYLLLHKVNLLFFIKGMGIVFFAFLLYLICAVLMNVLDYKKIFRK